MKERLKKASLLLICAFRIRSNTEGNFLSSAWPFPNLTLENPAHFTLNCHEALHEKDLAM